MKRTLGSSASDEGINDSNVGNDVSQGFNNTNERNACGSAQAVVVAPMKRQRLGGDGVLQGLDDANDITDIDTNDWGSNHADCGSSPDPHDDYFTRESYNKPCPIPQPVVLPIAEPVYKVHEWTRICEAISPPKNVLRMEPRFCHATGQTYWYRPGMIQLLYADDDLTATICDEISTILEVGNFKLSPTRDIIHRAVQLKHSGPPYVVFSMALMRVNDEARKMRIWLKDYYYARFTDRHTPSLHYYVGITEDPARRLALHCANRIRGHMPKLMRVVCVERDSSATAYWEKRAIKFVTQNLGGHRCLNNSDGGEGQSKGQPHYGYIIEC